MNKPRLEEARDLELLRELLFSSEIVPREAFYQNIQITLISVITGAAISFLAVSAKDAVSEGIEGYIAVFTTFLIVCTFWYSFFDALNKEPWTLDRTETLLYFTLGFIENLMVQFLTLPSSWFSLVGLFGVVAGSIYFKEAYRLSSSPDKSKVRMRLIRGCVAFLVGGLLIVITNTLFLTVAQIPLWYYLLPLAGVSIILGSFRPKRS